MAISEFDKVLNIIEEVLDIQPHSIDTTFRFKDHESWDSLATLSLLVLIQEVFGKIVSNDELSRVFTSGELMVLVESKR